MKLNKMKKNNATDIRRLEHLQVNRICVRRKKSDNIKNDLVKQFPMNESNAMLCVENYNIGLRNVNC